MNGVNFAARTWATLMILKAVALALVMGLGLFIGFLDAAR